MMHELENYSSFPFTLKACGKVCEGVGRDVVKMHLVSPIPDRFRYNCENEAAFNLRCVSDGNLTLYMFQAAGAEVIHHF